VYFQSSLVKCIYIVTVPQNAIYSTICVCKGVNQMAQRNDRCEWQGNSITQRRLQVRSISCGSFALLFVALLYSIIKFCLTDMAFG